MSSVAVGIEPANVIARLCPPSVVKCPPHQNLAVRLHREGIHSRARPRVEPAVQRPVGIESANVVARLPAQRRKPTPDQNLPVRLHRQRNYIVIRSRVELAVQRDQVHRQQGYRARRAAIHVGHHHAVVPGIARLEIRQGQGSPGSLSQRHPIFPPLVAQR